MILSVKILNLEIVLEINVRILIGRTPLTALPDSNYGLIRYYSGSYPQKPVRYLPALRIFLLWSLPYRSDSGYITVSVPEAVELLPPDIHFPGIYGW